MGIWQGEEHCQYQGGGRKNQNLCGNSQVTQNQDSSEPIQIIKEKEKGEKNKNKKNVEKRPEAMT